MNKPAMDGISFSDHSGDFLFESEYPSIPSPAQMLYTSTGSDLQFPPLSPELDFLPQMFDADADAKQLLDPLAPIDSDSQKNQPSSIPLAQNTTPFFPCDGLSPAETTGSSCFASNSTETYSLEGLEFLELPVEDEQQRELENGYEYENMDMSLEGKIQLLAHSNSNSSSSSSEDDIDPVLKRTSSGISRAMSSMSIAKSRSLSTSFPSTIEKPIWLSELQTQSKSQQEPELEPLAPQRRIHKPSKPKPRSKSSSQSQTSTKPANTSESQSRTQTSSQSPSTSPRKRGRKPSAIAPDDYRIIRLERGRLAANKCRKKRKEQEAELAARASKLLVDNDRMKREVYSLIGELEGMKASLKQCIECSCVMSQEDMGKSHVGVITNDRDRKGEME